MAISYIFLVAILFDRNTIELKGNYCMYTVRIFLTTILFLLLTVISQPDAISAQQNTDYVSPVENNSVTSPQGTVNNRFNNLEWLWLLPLLAIPLVFWGLRKMEDADNFRYYDPEIAGVKGGRSSDKNDEENQNFEKILL